MPRLSLVLISTREHSVAKHHCSGLMDLLGLQGALSLDPFVCGRQWLIMGQALLILATLIPCHALRCI